MEIINHKLLLPSLLTMAKAIRALSKTWPRALQLTGMGRVHLIMYLNSQCSASDSEPRSYLLQTDF